MSDVAFQTRIEVFETEKVCFRIERHDVHTLERRLVLKEDSKINLGLYLRSTRVLSSLECFETMTSSLFEIFQGKTSGID